MQDVKLLGEQDEVQDILSKAKKDVEVSFDSISRSGSNCFSPQTHKAIDTFPSSFENKQDFRISLGLADGKSLGSLELNDQYFESAEVQPQSSKSPMKNSKYVNTAKKKLKKKQQPDNQASTGLEANELSFEMYEKKGYLSIKSSNLFFKWQKHYFELEPFKIFWGLSKESLASKTDVRCINLLVNDCRITEIHGQEFNVSIEGLESVLKLKAASKAECKEWVDFLNEFFQLAKEHRSETQTYTRTVENLFRPDVILEEEFLESVDTGDLLLLRANHIGAKLQRLFTFSDYDHIALMLKASSEVYIFDTVYENGVQLTNWCDFKKRGIYRDYPVASLRKLNIKDSELLNDIKLKLWEFAAQHIGKKYELGIGKFLRNSSIFNSQVLPSASSPRSSYLYEGNTPVASTEQNIDSRGSKKSFKKSVEEVQSNEEGFFCSELVAAAYKSAGLLDASIASTRYLPVSFSQKKGLNLLKDASLSHEHGLAFIEEDRFKI